MVVVVVVLAEKASAILSKGWTFGEGIRVLWCRSNGSKVALDVAWETPPAGVRSPWYCFRHHRWWCRKTIKTLRDSQSEAWIPWSRNRERSERASERVRMKMSKSCPSSLPKQSSNAWNIWQQRRPMPKVLVSLPRMASSFMRLDEKFLYCCLSRGLALPCIVCHVKCEGLRAVVVVAWLASSLHKKKSTMILAIADIYCTYCTTIFHFAWQYRAHLNPTRPWEFQSPSKRFVRPFWLPSCRLVADKRPTSRIR